MLVPAPQTCVISAEFHRSSGRTAGSVVHDVWLLVPARFHNGACREYLSLDSLESHNKFGYAFAGDYYCTTHERGSACTNVALELVAGCRYLHDARHQRRCVSVCVVFSLYKGVASKC